MYCGSNDGVLYALQTWDGGLKWNYTTGGSIDIGQPFVKEDTIYIGSMDGFLYALNKADGGLKWKYATGAAIQNSPVAGGGVVYIGSDDHYLHAVNA